MYTVLLWTLYFSIVSGIIIPVVLAGISQESANRGRLEAPNIVGGTEASVRQYPIIAALLFAWETQTYEQGCGGTIITSRSILTAAHCIFGYHPINWQARVGSSYANWGGVVHKAATLATHPNYHAWTLDFDVGILRTATQITFVPGLVQSATLASSHYPLGDNEPVWAPGWGVTEIGGQPSEVLNHVQMWTINQGICRRLYRDYNLVTSNMLCAGLLGIGGRDQCINDSGSPLLHGNVVVGVCSWGDGCGKPFRPGVNARVSQLIGWIVQNAK